MNFKNKNYWAVILGGSSGLGFGTAKKLAQQGMNLCIVHRDRKENIPHIKNEFDLLREHDIHVISFNADALIADTRNHILSTLKEWMGKSGRVRVLVHSIAKGNLKPMVTIDDSSLQNNDFHITIDAMAISLYDWTKALIEQKLFSDSARVISFTSEGNTKAWPYYAAVSAAKATLEAITRNMAVELASLGITSNCIQAGAVDTPSFRAIPGNEKFAALALKKNPFKRLTTPEDIGNIVYLLCKDEAAWINGTVIKADGGESLQ
ncbi:MAG: short-chain dehydrogenase [Flavobacteriaceae bacterium CG2_30_34_30]|nr:MAG: short-chain dehydrogenase [Flavobacteriaceae bacterium CG2_30_34_30]PIQ17736.1 MAG: short-chain dehydrogenase [Flavobacteriaceae bacterium CG18_big_fil_WC_8_21_14_2_50_34_36]PIZ07744.1 MAG: short-chain dehydrogenase [Flavobacteriaceae bacterium CG_4_10_14_0_8_um_filter_34_31]